MTRPHNEGFKNKWERHTSRGQSNQLPTDEGTPRIYVKASRELGKKLF